MYKIKVRSHFSSAHSLRGYKGKCEDLHGHNWGVEVAVRADKLDKTGMVIDFKELKGMLKEVIAELDHRHLNDLEYFKEANPTSENIARYVFERLTERKTGIDICEVTVFETDTSSATYSVD
jgi:6-pyruvoyltetrahydropterin/6-carboxytetrahydropterin synthase